MTLFLHCHFSCFVTTFPCTPPSCSFLSFDILLASSHRTQATCLLWCRIVFDCRFAHSWITPLCMVDFPLLVHPCFFLFLFLFSLLTSWQQFGSVTALFSSANFLSLRLRRSLFLPTSSNSLFSLHSFLLLPSLLQDPPLRPSSSFGASPSDHISLEGACGGQVLFLGFFSCEGVREDNL